MKKTVIVKIKEIQKHPNADKLELIKFDVDGNEIQLVVGVHYAVDEYGVYIPVGAIIPDDIAEEMWLLGKLGGSDKNMVTPRNMRGIMSEGLFYGQVGKHWKPEMENMLGQDISNIWGITYNGEKES